MGQMESKRPGDRFTPHSIHNRLKWRWSKHFDSENDSKKRRLKIPRIWQKASTPQIQGAEQILNRGRLKEIHAETDN